MNGSDPLLVEVPDPAVVTLDGAEVEVEPSGPRVVEVVDGCVVEVSAAIDVVVEPSSPIVVVVVGGCVVEVSAAIDVVVEPSSPIVVVVVGAKVVVVVGGCVVEVSAAIDVVVEPSSPIVVVVVGAKVVVVVGGCVVEVSAAIDVVVGATVVVVVGVLVVVEVDVVEVDVVPWQLLGKYTDVVRVAVAPSGHDVFDRKHDRAADRTGDGGEGSGAAGRRYRRGVPRDRVRRRADFGAGAHDRHRAGRVAFAVRDGPRHDVRAITADRLSREDRMVCLRG